MAKTLNTVNTAADTFGAGYTKINDAISLIGTEVVTANSLANGAWTSGNGWVNGYFGANNIVIGTLRGGFLNSFANVTVSSNLVFSSAAIINGNVNINSISVNVGSNVSINTTTFSVGNSTVNAVMTSSGFSSNAVVANGTTVAVGANVRISTTGLLVGNSTQNLVLSSTGGTVNGISLAKTTDVYVIVANSGSNVSSRQRLNFIAGNNVTLAITDDVANTTANVVIEASITGLNSTATYTSSNTDLQTIDSWAFATWRSAEYLISVKNNAANAYQTTKLLLVHDGGSAYLTEYGQIYSNSSLGSYSASANSTHVLVQFTPTAANSTLKWVRWTVNN